MTTEEHLINSKNKQYLISDIIPLLDLCLSEVQLNVIIQHTKNIDILLLAIEVKLSYILLGQQRKTEFRTENLIDLITVGNCDKICNIFRILPLIQKNHSPLPIVEYIQKCRFISENETLITVKILNVALNACAANCVNSNYLIRLYLEICKNDWKAILNCFIAVLEMYFNIAGIDEVDNVCNAILNNHDLYTISCLIDKFGIFDTLSKHSNFWILLQKSLLNNINYQHKLCIYILKTSVSHIISNELNLNTQLDIIRNKITELEEFKQSWQNFFILMEVIQEKQLHLITPSFPLLHSIQNIHQLWLLCVYKSMLNHSQHLVVFYAVTDLLSATWYDDNLFPEIVTVIMQGINKIEFSDSCISTYNKLGKFIENLNNDNYSLLLYESLKIIWLPTAAWCFYFSTFNHDRDYMLPPNLIEKLTYQIKILPHKFIRDNCFELLWNFIVRKSKLSLVSFDDLTKLTINFMNYDRKYGKKIINDVSIHNVVDKVFYEILTWADAKYINVNKISLFMDIVKDNNSITEYIFSMTKDKKIDHYVRDNIFLNLCDKFYSDLNILNYLKDRCDELIPDYNMEILHKIVNYIKCDITNTDLYKQCTNILLKPSNFNSSQICLSYDILNLNPINESIIHILNIWKHKILNKREKTNANICKSYIRLHILKMLENKSDVTCESAWEIHKILEIIFDTQSEDVIISTFEYMKHFSLNNTRSKILIKRWFNELTKIRNNDLYKIGWNYCIEYLILNARTIETDNEFTSYLVDEITDIVNNNQMAAVIFSNNLKNISRNIHNVLIPLIVELSLYGSVYKKEKQVEYDICKKIVQIMQLKNDNVPIFQASSIRMSSVITLRNMVDGRSIIGDKIVSILLHKYKENYNKRYFPNSYIHLQKLRIMQILLVLHGYISIQKKEELIHLLMKSFCEESHQPCIKQLMQWLLIKLLQNTDNCIEMVITALNDANRTHQSTIVAFIPVLYHIALKKNKHFIDEVINTLLVWTMGAHFKLRIYSQYAILKLIQKNQNKSRNRNEGLRHALETVIAASDQQIKLILRNDIQFFEYFDHEKHYTFETIFIDIPKLNNVSCTEWENIELNTLPNYSDLLTQNLDSNFRSLNHKLCETEQTNYTVPVENIQRKINPWKNISERDNKPNISDLIVVTSLIESSANLGGLTRTCEIYSVKHMVLNDCKIINNKEFKSLSMSSENWVSMIEVKVGDLKKYLIKMKQTTYTIIGAEQTSQSIALNCFKFPKKCILLLGNEKEGISPELLPVLDACVEIPQFGVIRSLNVHVAGAIFIWEYVKQHIALT